MRIFDDVTGRNVKSTILLIALLSCPVAGTATDWKLSKHNSFIKVYTGRDENSAFKTVRVECTVSASLSQVLAAFFDIKGQEQWIYGDKSSDMLEKVSDSEFIYYSEVSVPWPLSNRDFIAHVRAAHPEPGTVIIDSWGEPAYLPPKKGLVRVPNSNSHVVLTCTAPNTTTIDYTIRFDPGGQVPAWVANLFVANGPYESFQKLPGKLNNPEYQKAHFAFLDMKQP